MKLLVTIPAYNEAATIESVVNNIKILLENYSDGKILVVDDGSIDNTAELAKRAGAIVVSHSQNKGLGIAFQTAINYARMNGFDTLVNIDADGQFDVNDIPHLLKPIREDKVDFVTASRFLSGEKIPNMPSVKLWGNHVVSILVSKLSGNKFCDVSCGFRAFGEQALYRISLYGRFTYTHEVFIDLVNKNMRILEIPVKVKYFTERKSKIARNVLKYGWNTLMIMLNTYRDWNPSKFFGGISLLFFVPGFIMWIILAVHYCLTGTFSPYKWLGIGGIPLVLIGVITVVVGINAQMFVRINKNQEELLYYFRKSNILSPQK